MERTLSGALFFSTEGKMKKQCFLKCLPIYTLISFNLYAQSGALNDFNQFFKNGQYTKAISSLEKISTQEGLAGEKFYLAGLTYSKLQEYDKAYKNFELAINENNTHIDIYYEYGQALYASNELKAARRAFSESVKRKYNAPASLYYVAHISQILEEYPKATDSYTELIKSQDADNKIKQIARFQLAETMLLMMREKNTEKEKLESSVEKYIVPMMKQALNTDKSTGAAIEIIQRIQEVEKEFNLDPNLLTNGKRISPKRYSGYVSQKVKFDDNISLINEENNVSQSKKESYIFESEVYGKYDFVLKKKFIISPDFRWNFIQHSDQNSPDVFQNDSFSLNANLKNKYEHMVRGQPASLMFDIEFSKINKDWKQEHKRIGYAKSTSFSLGELFNFFSVGDTSFKFKRKIYKGESEAINNNTNSLIGDQTIALPNQHLIIALFEADFVDNYNNSSTNTDSYLLRFDYLIPEILPKYTLAFAMATTVTDTKTQKSSRGTEFTFNPSLDLSKEINEKMKISINYDFTKNKSKLSDYSYQKNVFTTEFRYSF